MLSIVGCDYLIYCIDQRILKDGYDHMIFLYWSNVINIWLIKWSSRINNMLPKFSYDHLIVVYWWSVIKTWLWSPDRRLLIECYQYLVVITWLSIINRILSVFGYNLIVVHW